MARGTTGITMIVPGLILTVLCFKTVVCNWGRWGEWSEGSCPVTCGEGQRMVTRTRFCNDPSNECPGLDQDKKLIRCISNSQCGDLECYECNIFRSGKIKKCEDNTILKSCRACSKSYTQISLHDRMGYTKDSIVESRMCIRHDDVNTNTEEKCTYTKNNGGISIMCHCFSDRCNSGVRQGWSLTSFLFIALVCFFQKCVFDV